MRILRVEFSSPEEFEREYNSNLANAGVFVASEEPFELREPVQVDLVLQFAGRSVGLDGEVVHIVAPEMASAGGTAGVAVQFTHPTPEVRERLAPLIQVSGCFQRDPQDTGQRAAPRVPARVPIQVNGPEGPVQGRTRNLSRSGVLAELGGGAELEVGLPVIIELAHPVTGRSMRTQGRVARRLRDQGEFSALGLAFDSAADPDFLRFVEEIQSAEHSRLLGAISGSLAELGPQNLLQMFATSAPAGTLRLLQGDLEGVIGFERGLLRYARLGSATGMKALARLLAWEIGGFEFHSHLEPIEFHEAPLPLEAAMLEAVSRIDELSQIEPDRFPPRGRLQVVEESADGLGSSKVEEAVVDLARAGFFIERIVEVIPEPDIEIYRAIANLVDQGVVCCSE